MKQLIAALAVIVPVFAQAAPPIYGGLGISVADIKGSGNDTMIIPSIGYRFHKHLAAEASYLGGDDMHGLKLAVVGEGHIDKHPKWHLWASVGAYIMDGCESVVETTGTRVAQNGRCGRRVVQTTTTTTTRQSGSDTLFGVGLGARYAFGKTLSVRGGLELVEGSGDCDLRSILSVAIIKDF